MISFLTLNIVLQGPSDYKVSDVQFPYFMYLYSKKSLEQWDKFTLGNKWIINDQMKII